ncbi:UvrB/UvrC motif-containing protein [Paraburkholderia sp. A2WS-5]|uniref:UvrB/UvrC motif-containing protein n=1 Tax=Paraburkholderia sp. A2WS-5 TaxID=3028372 RepID=UPI003B8033B4
MPLTKGRIERTGRIVFHDASLHVWEEGLMDARKAGGWEAEQQWERQFKRDVFARIVQMLNRLGWTVMEQKRIFTSNNSRYCRKGDLRADIKLCGRHIEFDMFQNVNAPTRPDHGGRYEFNQESLMPYLMRLEMERTRTRIRDYLCNVFTGYEFEPPKVKSPNPDPLAYFNDSWDGEYEKKRGIHRFKRGADGWPSEHEINSWSRKDKDGALLNHGEVRWMRDRKGRVIRGRVYGGINGMWLFVYGPGERDHTHEPAGRFFTYRAGETSRKQFDARESRNRIERDLAIAVKTMRFERAAVLRDVLVKLGGAELAKAA